MSTKPIKRGPGRPARPEADRRIVWKVSLSQSERDAILKQTKTESLTDAIRKLAK